ncbi:MAG TPA: sensor domain-containing diguanylate cyclase [Spirochaetota bacterium]|nr:sensor domain-containing diguanylate cyclase [Spirochaetota bacterium]HPJ33465.1 sensor domain-containing diguanylate cyclase [Spirochaetota bacterium]
MGNRTHQMYANIGKLITSSLEIHQVVDGVMEEIKQFFDPEHWSLLRLDHTSGELYFIYIQGNDIEALKKFRLKPGEGIAGTVAETGESIFVPDARSDPRFSDRVDKLINFKTRSIIAVPLIHRGITYGVIEIVNCDKEVLFSEDDHLILKTIADFTAIAMANSSLYHQVIEQNCHDPLTGLFNRRMLHDYISQWSGKNVPSRRHSDSVEEIVVVYMDLDNFKDINDNYGHREGDLALVSVTGKLKNIFRSEDLLFRIGGDEFLAVMKVSIGEDISHIIERITDDFNSTFYTSPDGKRDVSISHGIARGSIREIESLITEADRQMYLKKEHS